MQGLRVLLGVCCSFALALGCGGKADGKATQQTGPADVEHCSNLADQPSAVVSVMLENQTSKPIYVGPERANCEPVLNSPYGIWTSTGAGVGTARACGNVSCAELSSGDYEGLACLNLCYNQATYTQLMPGEAQRTAWSAASLVSYELPHKCLGESTSLRDSCTRIESLPAGTELRFEAWASESLVCNATNACAACTRDSSGDCTVQAEELGEMKLSATATLLLDESYVRGDADAAVRLVFEE